MVEPWSVMSFEQHDLCQPQQCYLLSFPVLLLPLQVWYCRMHHLCQPHSHASGWQVQCVSFPPVLFVFLYVSSLQRKETPYWASPLGLHTSNPVLISMAVRCSAEMRAFCHTTSFWKENSTHSTNEDPFWLILSHFTLPIPLKGCWTNVTFPCRS